jgi:hypothetical protein
VQTQGIDKSTLHTLLKKLSGADNGIAEALVKLSTMTGTTLQSEVKALRAYLYVVHGNSGNAQSLEKARKLLGPKQTMPDKATTGVLVASLGHHNLTRSDLITVAGCLLPPATWVIQQAPTAASLGSSSKRKVPRPSTANVDIAELCGNDPFIPVYPVKIPLDELSRSGKVISELLSSQTSSVKHAYRTKRFHLDHASVEAFKSMGVFASYQHFKDSKGGKASIPRAPQFAAGLAEVVLPLLVLEGDARQARLNEIWDTEWGAGLQPAEEEYDSMITFLEYLDRVFSNAQLDKEQEVLTNLLEGTLSNGSKFLPYGPECIIRLLTQRRGHGAARSKWGSPVTNPAGSPTSQTSSTRVQAHVTSMLPPTGQGPVGTSVSAGGESEQPSGLPPILVLEKHGPPAKAASWGQSTTLPPTAQQPTSGQRRPSLDDLSQQAKFTAFGHTSAVNMHASAAPSVALTPTLAASQTVSAVSPLASTAPPGAPPHAPRASLVGNPPALGEPSVATSPKSAGPIGADVTSGAQQQARSVNQVQQSQTVTQKRDAPREPEYTLQEMLAQEVADRTRRQEEEARAQAESEALEQAQKLTAEQAEANAKVLEQARVEYTEQIRRNMEAEIKARLGCDAPRSSGDGPPGSGATPAPSGATTAPMQQVVAVRASHHLPLTILMWTGTGCTVVCILAIAVKLLWYVLWVDISYLGSSP